MHNVPLKFTFTLALCAFETMACIVRRMSNDPELIISPLSQTISSGGRTIDVHIYQLEGEKSWALEVEDEYGNSTVWDEGFPTEVAALVKAKKTILAEGVSSLIGPEDGKGNDGWK